MSNRIGETSALVACQTCGKLFHYLEFNKWCEDCFDAGLQKDMDEHFKNTIKKELEETGVEKK